MILDPGLELSGALDEYMRFTDHFPNQNPSNVYGKLQPIPQQDFLSQQNRVSSMPCAAPSHAPNRASSAPRDDSMEYSEINSDIVLSYISNMLLEEDMEDKVYMHQGDSALVAAEKPFFDILTENPSPFSFVGGGSEGAAGSGAAAAQYIGGSGSWNCINGSGNDGNNNSNNNEWVTSLVKSRATSQTQPTSFDHSSPSSFSSSTSTSNSTGSGALDGPEQQQQQQHLNSGTDNGRVEEFFLESQSFSQFKKGVEEASKFLPDSTKFVIDLKSYGFSSANNIRKENSKSANFRAKNVAFEKKEEDVVSNGSKGRKYPFHYHEDLDLEEQRSIKQTAISSDDTLRSKLFDEVLLCPLGGRCKDAITTLREELQNGVSKNMKNGSSKSSSSGRSKGKKQVKKDVVDLRTLLIHCAQSVAADDRRSAYELLKQIRQHSSELGDGPQRLAQIFADGLEARLAGTGSQIYHSLTAKRTTATDILKAYQLYVAACPFKRISHFFANQTILNVAEKATRLHIIDFGIYFGFQWPCLIQRLALRPGGPPKLRITGIDVPQPGFRPNEQIEESGRRLADYARSFKVEFEYHPIASKWENIRIEDLNIRKDEVLVVNCLYKFRNLVDETVVVDSPRTIVLNNIRKMNPDIFIHGVVNGAYSAPFFVTRFREALFHFSSLFDMLDTTVPREKAERLLIEREIFGREAMNVIACEGSERVERPETYKQWQVRHLRAGFSHLPLEPDIMKKAKEKVKSCYNKDFVIDEDNRWLMQGWKGRVIYALSTWKPSNSKF